MYNVVVEILQHTTRHPLTTTRILPALPNCAARSRRKRPLIKTSRTLLPFPPFRPCLPWLPPPTPWLMQPPCICALTFGACAHHATLRATTSILPDAATTAQRQDNEDDEDHNRGEDADGDEGDREEAGEHEEGQEGTVNTSTHDHRSCGKSEKRAVSRRQRSVAYLLALSNERTAAADRSHDCQAYYDAL